MSAQGGERRRRLFQVLVGSSGGTFRSHDSTDHPPPAKSDRPEGTCYDPRQDYRSSAAVFDVLIQFRIVCHAGIESDI